MTYYDKQNISNPINYIGTQSAISCEIYVLNSFNRRDQKTSACTLIAEANACCEWNLHMRCLLNPISAPAACETGLVVH